MDIEEDAVASDLSMSDAENVEEYLHLENAAGKELDSSATQPADESNSESDGSLACLLTLPSDFLPEICSHLTPLDVLRWSRSCKFFRSQFFVKTGTVAVSCWRSARRNVGLPDLIWPMDEPAYASLIYDDHCMGADCNRICSPGGLLWWDLSHRTRFCRACEKHTFETVGDHQVARAPPELQELYTRCVSFDRMFSCRNPRSRTYKKRDLEEAKTSSTPMRSVKSIRAEICLKVIDAHKLESWWENMLEERKETRREEARIRRRRLRKAEPDYTLRCLYPSEQDFVDHFETVTDMDYIPEVRDLDEEYWSKWEESAGNEIWYHQDSVLFAVQATISHLCTARWCSPFVKSCHLPFLERIRKLLDKGDRWKMSDDFLSDLSQFFLFHHPNHPNSTPGWFPEYFGDVYDPANSTWVPRQDHFEVCLVLVAASPLAPQEIVTEKELDDLGSSFECLLCEAESRERFDWFSIVDHILEVHPSSEKIDSISYKPSSTDSNESAERVSSYFYEEEEDEEDSDA